MAKDVGYCASIEDFHLFPWTAKAVALLNRAGFKVIVVTNQSGVGRGYFTEEVLVGIHRKMRKELEMDGAYLDDIYYCPHHPNDGCHCRKPQPAMVLEASIRHRIDLSRSVVVGDNLTDMELGHSLGCRTILVGATEVRELGGNHHLQTDTIVSDLLEAVRVILRERRRRGRP
jgi:histidinol-phosphate phosphatase family protein